MVFRQNALLFVGIMELTLAAPAAAQSRPSGDGPDIRLSLRTNPFVNLYFQVRSLAEAEGAPTAQPEYAAAVEAARKLNDELKIPAAWGLIDAAAAASSSAAGFHAFAEVLPENRTMAGKKIMIRPGAMALADELEKLEAKFLEKDWPKLEAQVKEATDRLERLVVANSDKVYRHIFTLLGMEKISAEIPVLLVHTAPFPGGFTLRTRSGPLCVVGVGVPVESTLCEVVIHETIHALDVLTNGKEHALVGIRKRLEAAGAKPSDTTLHDIPHTLIFVQAAATVRATLFPDHKDYGDTNGYYAKASEAVAAVRGPWERHLKGELGLDEALDAIAAAAKKP